MQSRFVEAQLSNDCMSAMKCLSIKRLVPALPCFFLVAEADSTDHRLTAVLRSIRKTENAHIIAVDDLKLRLMAQTCNVPGMFSLIANMITSYDQLDSMDYASWEKEYMGTHMLFFLTCC